MASAMTHDVREAVDAIRRTEPDEVPPTWALDTLAYDRGTPIWIDDREIREISIRSGSPGHGALRSDDHVGEYEIEYDGHCPSCRDARLRFSYGSYHHIAGYFSVECTECGGEIESEEWS